MYWLLIVMLSRVLMVSDEKIENIVNYIYFCLSTCLPIVLFKIIPHDLEGSQGTYAQCRGCLLIILLLVYTLCTTSGLICTLQNELMFSTYP
jgi:hypothetical protein